MVQGSVEGIKKILGYCAAERWWMLRSSDPKPCKISGQRTESNEALASVCGLTKVPDTSRYPQRRNGNLHSFRSWRKVSENWEGGSVKAVEKRWNFDASRAFGNTYYPHFITLTCAL